MVKWVHRIRLDEEENESKNDWVDSKHWLPICTQDVETHVALSVNVGMVDWCVTVADGRIVGITVWDVHCEIILSTFPQAVFLS